MTQPPQTPQPDPAAALRWGDDKILVQRLLDGDRMARRRFVERMACVPRFLAAANTRMGSPLSREDLADLSQDTLVVIWKKLGTFEGRATLESWCWRFCQLELANRVRLVRRRQSMLVPHHEERLDDRGQGIDPDPLLDFEHLERGLQALGQPEEEIIRLKHYEHLKFSEIGDRLAISSNTAKTRYYRGIAWLKQYLERRGEGGI